MKLKHASSLSTLLSLVLESPLLSTVVLQSRLHVSSVHFTGYYTIGYCMFSAYWLALDLFHVRRKLAVESGREVA